MYEDAGAVKEEQTELFGAVEVGNLGLFYELGEVKRAGHGVDVRGWRLAGAGYGGSVGSVIPGVKWLYRVMGRRPITIA